mmetsp:Transcript_18199/g.52567  ORF Transcript_18199/g.52567 Transcript_18199/m.52567 type:complete len:101 (-) Transcript_18199:73-375(-)
MSPDKDICSDPGRWDEDDEDEDNPGALLLEDEGRGGMAIGPTGLGSAVICGWKPFTIMPKGRVGGAIAYLLRTSCSSLANYEASVGESSEGASLGWCARG